MSAGPILEFRGEYRFLSNFWIEDPLDPLPVWVPSSNSGGDELLLAGRSVEHLFQAAKVGEANEQAKAILRVEQPADAKKMGSRAGKRMPDGSLFRVELRPDWEQVKFDVMLAALEAKFQPQYELADRLLATGYRMLVEGNTWGDTTWGAIWMSEEPAGKAGLPVWSRFQNGGRVLAGHNWLGRLLMFVRAELDCAEARRGAT